MLRVSIPYLILYEYPKFSRDLINPINIVCSSLSSMSLNGGLLIPSCKEMIFFIMSFKQLIITFNDVRSKAV